MRRDEYGSLARVIEKWQTTMESGMKLQTKLNISGIAAAAISLAPATSAMAGEWYAGAGVTSSKNAYNAQD